MMGLVWIHARNALSIALACIKFVQTSQPMKISEGELEI